MGCMRACSFYGLKFTKICNEHFSGDTYSSITSDMDDVSSVYSDITTGIDDFISYTAPSKPNKPKHKKRTETDPDDAMSVSSSDLASLSLSDSESLSTWQVDKMCLHIHCDGRKEEYVRHLYQSLFDWIDPTGEVYNIINETDLPRGYGCNDKVPPRYDDPKGCDMGKRHCILGQNGWHKPIVEMPSLAIVLFLREDAMVGSEKLDMASSIFNKEPWKFHHSESISRGKINAYPYNNQNYYTAGPNDPLCAIRQIHCGKQHVRLVRFTSIETWQNQINLYSLILGQEPEVRKPDFCLFTAASYGEYDVQFALKKVPNDIMCKSSSGSALGFKIGQMGNLVPLLPNMCSPMSDTRWRTTDLDGNAIYLDILKPSRDSDSGVSTSCPLHSTPYSKADKTKIRNHRKLKHKSKHRTVYMIYSGDDSDSSSTVTDLDTFMKSVLQPLMENNRSKTPSISSSTDSVKSEDKTSEVSESSAKSSTKSVRFNQIVHYLSDCGYPTDTEQEDDSGIILNGNDTEHCPSHDRPKAAIPPTRNECHKHYCNDTDEESYFSEAGIDVDFPSQNTKSAVITSNPCRPKEPPPYRPPPPHPNAKKVSLGFYI